MATVIYGLTVRIEIADMAIRNNLAAKVKTFLLNEKTGGLVATKLEMVKDEYSKNEVITENL